MSLNGGRGRRGVVFGARHCCEGGLIDDGGLRMGTDGRGNWSLDRAARRDPVDVFMQVEWWWCLCLGSFCWVLDKLGRTGWSWNKGRVLKTK